MNLLYTADGHRTDFDESERAEVPRLQDIHLTMIAKQDVFLMLKGVLLHGPKRTSDPGVIQSSSMIRVMVMMVINRSKAREEHRPADVRLRALFAAKDVGGAQRFGQLAFVEVGAMSVDRIQQVHPPDRPFSRGNEKSVFK